MSLLEPFLPDVFHTCVLSVSSAQSMSEQHGILLFYFFSVQLRAIKWQMKKREASLCGASFGGKTSPGSSAVKRGKTRGLRPLLIWSDLVLITFTRPICLLRGAVSNGCVSGRCRSEFQALRLLFDRVNDWLGQVTAEIGVELRGAASRRGPKLRSKSHAVHFIPLIACLTRTSLQCTSLPHSP